MASIDGARASIDGVRASIDGARASIDGARAPPIDFIDSVGPGIRPSLTLAYTSFDGAWRAPPIISSLSVGISNHFSLLNSAGDGGSKGCNEQKSYHITHENPEGACCSAGAAILC